MRRGGAKGYCLGLLLGVAAISAPIGAAPAVAATSDQIARTLSASRGIDADLAAFYRARGNQPLWVQGDRLRPEARRVLELVSNARNDGLNPSQFDTGALADAIAAADSGEEADLARAELLLSQTFAAYVRALRRPVDLDMVYVDRELAPAPFTSRGILNQAASAGSLDQGIDAAVRMNPLYTRMREVFAEHRARGEVTPAQERLLQANLERARALPADLGRRFILVDAASARLWMYEDGQVAGSMRVVVGKTSEQTPLMAGYIRHLTVNPYWNVPPDLVQRRIAPAVLSRGLTYLRDAGYEVLSDWTEHAEVVDPETVDWQAVADGRTELRVRQQPGPTNAMGRMKFMFPNDRGVYLHDTPNRELFDQDDRRQSSGCVRVEDAERLAEWLFERPVRARSSAPEQNVSLPEPVPVYITYLTAAPEGTRIAFHQDAYGRDRQLLARMGGGSLAGAR
jgi:L,D-transpeptidase YcbB